jgi:hypothetical protein
MVFKTLFSNNLTLVTKNEYFEHTLFPYFYTFFACDTSGVMIYGEGRPQGPAPTARPYHFQIFKLSHFQIIPFSLSPLLPFSLSPLHTLFQ